MPFLSSSSTPASRVRRPPSCPPAGCPWWTVAVGVGSGKSSLNKLVWQLIWVRMVVVSHGFFAHGGCGSKVVVVFVPCLFKSTVVSETGFRLWIWRDCSCSSWCIFSTMLCFVVDLSGRKAALASSGVWRRLLKFLLAMMPNGRQVGNSLVFVSSFSGECWRRSGGEINTPSGSVPGGADFGSSSLPRRTRLHFSISVQGPSSENAGPGCNFIFLWGPCCTALKY
jgi:hypothetical protein